jgi:hypothetical protein
MLFGTQKEWEAHVKADHPAEWRCPLCEDEDVVYDDRLQIIHHFEAEHSDDLESLTLATLLPWSEVQRTGIVACPLCSSYGLEDSPEIVSHVLKHVYEFSMRALPWTPPVLFDLNREVGRYVLPEDEEAARRLEEWVENAEAGTSTTLELLESAAGLEKDLDAHDAVFTTGYVPEDEYFDNESEAEASQKPEKAGTDSCDLDSRSSDSKLTQKSFRSGSVKDSAPVSEAENPLADPDGDTTMLDLVYDGSEHSDDHQASEASDAESSKESKGIDAHVAAPDGERDNGSTVPRHPDQTHKGEGAISRLQSEEEDKHKGKDAATVLQEEPLVVEHDDQNSDTSGQTVEAVIVEPSERSEPGELGNPVEQESDGSGSSLDENKELFRQRQRVWRRRRRNAVPFHFGKRTVSEVSDRNDSESDISDVNQVGSSASRMRRIWRRPALLFQDPPEPTEEVEPDGDEDGRPGDLAMELPYWNLEIMEVDE